MSPDRHDPHPLAPDDPRLSEWLDGRLTAAEAAEVERLVAASPELTRLVADLRGMRGALGAVPVTPPPAGFVRDVLAAIDAAGAEAGDEAEVEEEWRRIERQRLEGEIAEAQDDAAEPAGEPMRQRWPWLALAGALAAGVLVAVVINRPGGPVGREVALVEHPPAGKKPPTRRSVDSAADEKAEVADTWLEKDADRVPADARAVADGENREKAAEAGKALADRLAAPAGDVAGRGNAVDGQRSGLQQPREESQKGGSGEAEVERLARSLDGQRQAADKLGGKPGASMAGGGGADPGALASQAAPPPAAPAAPSAAAAAEPRVRTVTYRIRTTADRRRLDDLVAASGGVQRRALDARADEQLRRKAAAFAEAKSDRAAAAEGPAAEGGPATERLVLSGPAATLASLAVALEATPDPGTAFGTGGAGEALNAARGRSADTEQAGAAATPAAKLEALKESEQADQAQDGQLAKRREPEALLVIEIVDESGVADAEGGP